MMRIRFGALGQKNGPSGVFPLACGAAFAILAGGFVPGVVLGVAPAGPAALPATVPAASPAVPDPMPFSDRYPVEIDVLGAEQARLVVETGIDVDGVLLPEGPAMPGTVRAYVNRQESEALSSLGFEARPVPREDKETFAAVRRGWQERAARNGGVARPLPPGERDWPSFEELQAELQAVAVDHPDLCRLISIGNSVQGRPLWFMKISDNPNSEEAEPEFKFTSSLHGDEVTGMELCRRMIHYLVDNYGTDPAVTNLVDSAELWFNPHSNPDGYVNHSRYNAQGYDLNRSFPDPITDPIDNPAGRPTETQHLMNFGYPHNFILSANYHGGALVMNIPWDCQHAQTPDHDMIWAVAEGYSYRNPPMWNSTQFYHGVTLGADWYVIHGGMQDWCYNWRNEVDITIEVSTTKWPAYSQMDTYWGNNRDSMLWYMNRVINGGIVKGIVTDGTTSAPLAATVNVVEIGKEIISDTQVGDYHRMLLPGTYTLTFTKEGYETQTISNVVVTEATPTVVDVSLFPVGTSVAGGEASRAGLSLSAPWPNPLLSSSEPMRMDLAMPAAGTVTVGVFDVRGRMVRELVHGSLSAGTHGLSWDGRTEGGVFAADGIYWVRAVAAGGAVQRMVALIR